MTFSPGANSVDRVRASVVIPARNEEESIGPCLDAVLASLPRDCEIIVVNDASEDRTAQVVRARQSTAAGAAVRLVTLEDPGAGSAGHKKRAITRGVTEARGEFVLQTDADCIPGPGWVPTMLASFAQGVGFVAGPVAIQPDDRFLSGFQALEMAGFVGIGAGAIALGRPAISNGANIAYRRDVFLAVRGHQGLDHLSSGDDALLMQRVAADGRWSVAICLEREAIVVTRPQATLRAFMDQRRRWASKSLHFPDIGLVAVCIVIFLALAFLLIVVPASVFVPAFRPAAMTGALIKIAGEGLMLWTITRRLGSVRLLRWLIPSQPLQVLYIVVASILGLTGGFSWKDRSVRR